jgi:hypothetical protein
VRTRTAPTLSSSCGSQRPPARQLPGTSAWLPPTEKKKATSISTTMKHIYNSEETQVCQVPSTGTRFSQS